MPCWARELQAARPHGLALVLAWTAAVYSCLAFNSASIATEAFVPASEAYYFASSIYAAWSDASALFTAVFSTAAAAVWAVSAAFALPAAEVAVSGSTSFSVATARLLASFSALVALSKAALANTRAVLAF